VTLLSWSTAAGPAFYVQPDNHHKTHQHNTSKAVHWIIRKAGKQKEQQKKKKKRRKDWESRSCMTLNYKLKAKRGPV
jgi:hypothetical protein